MSVHFHHFPDLPPRDMLFGTFRNPRDFAGDCGFDGGADRKLGAMLAFRDVNEDFHASGSMGQQRSTQAAVS